MKPCVRLAGVTEAASAWCQKPHTYIRCDKISVQVDENKHGVDGNDLPAAILVQARRTGLDEVEI